MMARSGCRGWSSVRKVVEKIKTLWFRSGELLRSMSGRRKLSQEARDWLQDSEVYSET